MAEKHKSLKIQKMRQHGFHTIKMLHLVNEFDRPLTPAKRFLRDRFIFQQPQETE